MSDSEKTPFVDVLATGVKAWDSWASRVDSDDAGERTGARIERRGVEQRLSDMLVCNSVEVARLLVTLQREVDALGERINEIEGA